MTFSNSLKFPSRHVLPFALAKFLEELASLWCDWPNEPSRGVLHNKQNDKLLGHHDVAKRKILKPVGWRWVNTWAGSRSRETVMHQQKEGWQGKACRRDGSTNKCHFSCAHLHARLLWRSQPYLSTHIQGAKRKISVRSTLPIELLITFAMMGSQGDFATRTVITLPGPFYPCPR